MYNEKFEENSKPRLQNGINYVGDKGPKFGARHVQITMVAFGLAIAFSTKMIFSVAIVAMTNSTTSSNPNVPTYDWNNKSVIISALLWSGVLVNLPAGYLGKKYGPKWFIVGASAANSVSFMLIPLFAKFAGSTGVIICRLGQGLAQGFMHPVNAVIMGRWAPPEERSRLGFIAGGSTTICVMISSIATGFIAESYLGWPWIYYIFGIIELAWTVLYILVGKQSVADHKTISPAEKEYLETTLFVVEEHEKTPWKQIIHAMPVWAIIIGGAGFSWATVTMSTEMAIFLAQVMNFDVKTNGIVMAAPSIIGLTCGIVIAIVSDLIPKRGILSVVNSRRVFHLVGSVGLSISLFAMNFVPKEHREWAIVLLCLASAFTICSVVGGTSTNLLDISPKYAGFITGLSETIAQIISIFAPLLVNWICVDETDPMQWALAFGISAIISISTAIFFVIFASGERQSWETESDKEAEIERQIKRSSIISMPPGVVI